MAKNSIYSASPFLTLDSSDKVSLRLYQENKPHSFKNRLPCSMKLEGQNWEVGLVWARLPFTWRNIQAAVEMGILVRPDAAANAELKKKLPAEFHDRKRLKESRNPFIKRINNLPFESDQFPETSSGFLHYYFPAGFYMSRYEVGKKLEADLNKLLAPASMSVHFFERTDRTFGFNVIGGKIGIWTRGYQFLKGVLGQRLQNYEVPGTIAAERDGAPSAKRARVEEVEDEEETDDEEEGGAEAREPKTIVGIVDLEQSLCKAEHFKPFPVFGSIELYCDAIDKYVMGNNLVQHIAAVSTHNVKHGETFVHQANPIVYYPVSSDNFSEIGVTLAYRTGDPVWFRGGESDRVSVQLHFRQRRLGI